MASGTIYVNPSTIDHLRPEFEGRLAALDRRVVWNETGRGPSGDDLARQMEDAVAIIAGAERYDRELLSSASGLKLIARFGVGYDAVDLDAAGDNGIAVSIVRGVNADSVADLTWAMILSLACDLHNWDAAMKAGDWLRGPFVGVAGRTLGIVGYGPVGQAVGRRAAGFGIDVVVCDPVLDGGSRPPEVSLVTDLAGIIERADILTLHLPRTGDKPLIGEGELAAMKPGAILVNAARGGLVDEDALLGALASGRLAGAGLDVFEDEPTPRFAEFARHNVIMSPHVAGASHDALAGQMDACISAIAAVLYGGQTRSTFLVGGPADS